MKLRVAYDDDDGALEIRNDHLFPAFEKLGWKSSGPDDDTWEVPEDWEGWVEEQIEVLNNDYEVRMVAVWGESVWVTQATLVTSEYTQLCAPVDLEKRVNAALPPGMKIVLGAGPLERSAGDYAPAPEVKP